MSKTEKTKTPRVFEEAADYSEFVGFVPLIEWLDGECMEQEAFEFLLFIWNGAGIVHESNRIAAYRAATGAGDL